MSVAAAVRPASDKQLAFVSDLLRKATGLTDEQREEAFDRVSRSYTYNEAKFDSRTGRRVTPGGVAVEVVLTKDGASAWIEKLLTMQPPKGERRSSSAPREQGPSSSFEPTPGMYRTSGGDEQGEGIVRVYLGQNSGRMLAKQVVGTKATGYSYEYLGAASRFVTPTTPKLSLDEAKEWGRMTGTCCVCARRLDDPESVDAGIGPVCGKRMSEGFAR